MNLGSFVVWLLIARGVGRGTAAGGLVLPSPNLPRRQKEKMWWSGVRVTTSSWLLKYPVLQTHTYVYRHTTSCSGSTQDWSVLKYFKQFISGQNNVPNNLQEPLGPHIKWDLGTSYQKSERRREKMILTRLPWGEGYHALQGLLFTCFSVVCSRNTWSRSCA